MKSTARVQYRQKGDSRVNRPMIILGLNAYHGDSSACLVVGGKLVAAALQAMLSLTGSQRYWQ